MAKFDGFTKSFPKAAGHLGLVHQCKANVNRVILSPPFVSTSEQETSTAQDGDQASYEFEFGCSFKDDNHVMLTIYYLSIL